MSPRVTMVEPSSLHHGDCIGLMRQMPRASVDFVLTDPPYLVGYRDRSGRSIANDVDGSWLAPAFSETFRLLKADSYCVSFYGWGQVDQFVGAWRQAGFRIVGHLVFAKDYASSAGHLRYCHEQAFLLAKGFPPCPCAPMNDVRGWAYTGNRLHPTQKPVRVLRPLVRGFSPVGGVVLDPFCGSGSTLVAARAEHRGFIGMELDEQFYLAARDRLMEG